MSTLWTSRHPLMWLMRITLFVGVGWWLMKNFAFAQLPTSHEFPKTNFDKFSVEPDEIRSGGPPRDGIPSLDAPKFAAVASAPDYLNPREPVVSVSHAHDHRAYPLSILIWHEIVNDEVGGLPVTVTFCPLCNATLVFDRRVDGRILDFGTTGRLRKSDMVMYDRQTETWWQQFTGVGIVGDLTGVELRRVPASIVAYEDFAAAHPGGKVLTRETGHDRRYGENPYRGYDEIGTSPFLFFDPVDPRLPAMERVLNISVGKTHKLYPFSGFERTPIINDVVANIPVVVFSKRGTLSALDAGEIARSRKVPSATAFARTVNGQVLTFKRTQGVVTDEETHSTWNLLGHAVDGPLKSTQLDALDSGVHFAFAWLAFRPQSTIYGQ